jgi:hypothetical protein
MTLRQVFTWLLACGLLATTAVSLAVSYAAMESAKCDVSSESSGWPLFALWVAAVVLAFALFVVSTSFAPDRRRRRHLHGVLIIFLTAWALIVIAFSHITGIQWRSNGALSMILGPAAIGASAYALFAVVKSRPLGKTTWRYVIAVPFAALVGLAILFAKSHRTLPANTADKRPGDRSCSPSRGRPMGPSLPDLDEA